MVRQVTIAALLDQYKPQLLRAYRFPTKHLQTLQAIQDCRTPALGGHVYACTSCGSVHFAYHSCRNRHCPRCQQTARARWVNKRMGELLAVPYFHVVFTLPHHLNDLCKYITKPMYDLLFQAAWQTVRQLGNDPKWLGARMGMTAVLHTWGQNLSLHPHVHCLIPGGGLTSGGKWKHLPYGEKYLFPRKVLQQVFRGKFMEGLRRLFEQGRLSINDQEWRILKRKLYRKDWVVYAKRPFARPDIVVKYLGRYTHRIAITHHRLIKLENDQVYFHYKDYRDGKKKIMHLHAVEFLRRFCQHILPAGFRRLRHYGLLSNFRKKTDLATARQQLGTTIIHNKVFPDQEQGDSSVAMLPAGVRRCPDCKEGMMIKVGVIPQQRPPPGVGLIWYGLDEN